MEILVRYVGDSKCSIASLTDNVSCADIELWSKEAPLACRNFIQLAMEGYYNNTIVHKVIKGLLIKMGDPTGSGTGN